MRLCVWFALTSAQRSFPERALVHSVPTPSLRSPSSSLILSRAGAATQQHPGPDGRAIVVTGGKHLLDFNFWPLLKSRSHPGT
uniref:Putative secreted protein n=1 Tax=Anopheles darlingi TaxID=43151 RepID=A0A2M4DF88_ANODA